jgi:hypothetical protein
MIGSMNPSVYLETSVVSYLVARPSRDIVTAAHQQLTADWWSKRRGGFTLFTSELVIQEISLGDPDTAQRRLAAVEGVSLLATTDQVREFARHLIDSRVIPPGAAADAAHIAAATVHGIEYLLTWNCRHIANAEIRGCIERSCRDRGYEAPVLCTPEELMGG